MHCWVHATFTQERLKRDRRKSRNNCLTPFNIFLTSFVSSSCGQLVSQKNLQIQFQYFDVSMLSENHPRGPTSDSKFTFSLRFLGTSSTSRRYIKNHNTTERFDHCTSLCTQFNSTKTRPSFQRADNFHLQNCESHVMSKSWNILSTHVLQIETH